MKHELREADVAGQGRAGGLVFGRLPVVLAWNDAGCLPGGTLEPQFQLVRPSRGSQGLPQAVVPHVGVGPQGVPTVQLSRNPIAAGLVGQFVLKGAEEPVPDDEHAAIVAIDVQRVLGVVHAVIRWRHKNPFKRPEPANMFGVYPELVDEIQAAH